ncbi:hypothetical protein LC1Hm_0465 [Halomicrobium sp. LC1Hm]|nr:hypothetical protein LC1Hm_0465 [Halomicrobium sp. LC1Hm]
MEEIEDNHKPGHIRAAKNRPEYVELRERLEKDIIDLTGQNKIEIKNEDATVYEVVQQQGAPFTFVSFVVNSGTSEISASIEIPVQNPNEIRPHATLEIYTEDGAPKTTRRYKFKGTDGRQEERRHIQPQRRDQHEIVVKEHDVSEVIAQLEDEQGEIRVQDQNKDVGDINCSQCKEIAEIARMVGCSATSGAICMIVTAKTIVGSIACAVAVGAICWINLKYGPTTPEDICEIGDAC